MNLQTEHRADGLIIATTYNIFASPLMVHNADIPELIRELEIQLHKEDNNEIVSNGETDSPVLDPRTAEV
ncbi:hypothetical protein FACS1894109_11130 [Spirochaetia bacterium]|nr:hypothetical protein FACS1894109_11130 [Spirochaetia bacterium]